MESTHRLCSVRKAPFSPFTVKLQLLRASFIILPEEERKPLFSKNGIFPRTGWKQCPDSLN